MNMTSKLTRDKRLFSNKSELCSSPHTQKAPTLFNYVIKLSVKFSNKNLRYRSYHHPQMLQ